VLLRRVSRPFARIKNSLHILAHSNLEIVLRSPDFRDESKNRALLWNISGAGRFSMQLFSCALSKFIRTICPCFSILAHSHDGNSITARCNVPGFP
jgi:hypothetical protein